MLKCSILITPVLNGYLIGPENLLPHQAGDVLVADDSANDYTTSSLLYILKGLASGSIETPASWLSEEPPQKAFDKPSFAG